MTKKVRLINTMNWKLVTELLHRAIVVPGAVASSINKFLLISLGSVQRSSG